MATNIDQFNALYKEGDHHMAYSYILKSGLEKDTSPEILNIMEDQEWIGKMYQMIEDMQSG
jgi:hypothetical protein